MQGDPPLPLAARAGHLLGCEVQAEVGVIVHVGIAQPQEAAPPLLENLCRWRGGLSICLAGANISLPVDEALLHSLPGEGRQT